MDCYGIFGDLRAVASGVTGPQATISGGLFLNGHNSSRGGHASSEEGKKLPLSGLRQGRRDVRREHVKDHTKSS